MSCPFAFFMKKVCLEFMVKFSINEIKLKWSVRLINIANKTANFNYSEPINQKSPSCNKACRK